MTETHQQQLEWERRAGRLAAVAALLALVLPLMATAYFASAVSGEYDTDAQRVAAADSDPSVFVISSVLQALGFLALAPVFLYLWRAARYRRPETRATLPVAAIAGPLLLAVGIVASQLDLVGLADGFGRGSEQQADDVLDDRSPVMQGLVAGGFAVLGVAFVLAGLYAMRAGLLSRFMGYLGVVLGALGLLASVGGVAGLAGGPVQFFWLGALALLFLGRWPGGRGPAWESGEATPWPTAAEQAERRDEGLQQGGQGSGSANGSATSEDPESADPDVPRPRSRKRKKRGRR